MELGKVKLQRSGVNNLLNALHPEHGVLWTDGKGIYLAPVHLYRDQVEKAASKRLGEFEHVQSVHWSCPMEHGTCFMVAVHQKHVTVWHVSGAAPHLAFKQIRRISVQIIPQGCLWNPKCDVICVLSRQQCSFYFRHMQGTKGSFAFPCLENEKISCGCWSPDGNRLVICVGTALLIYTWPDIEANISEFVTTAWRIPGLSGSITAVVAAGNDSVVCASDLPLDKLCKSNNSDAFTTPGIAGGVHSGSGDMIRPHGVPSVKDSLLNLQPNPQTKGQDTAMLTLVQMRPELQDPIVVARTVIPGLLTPDILHFQLESQCIVVGSNTQNILQIFAVLDNHLLPSDHVVLEKDQRPKGICGPHEAQMTGSYGVLVLVGTAEPVDPTFPSANNTTPFSISLRFFPTRPEKAKKLPNGHPGAARTPSASSLKKSESMREHLTKSSVSESSLPTRQSSYKGERRDHRFRSPDRVDSGDVLKLTRLSRVDSGDIIQTNLVEDIPSDSPRSLIEEVDGSKGEQNSASSKVMETERVEFSQSVPHFQNSKLSQAYELEKNGYANKDKTAKGGVCVKDKVVVKDECVKSKDTKLSASNPTSSVSASSVSASEGIKTTTTATEQTTTNGHSHSVVAEKPVRNSTVQDGGSLHQSSQPSVSLLHPRESSSPQLPRSVVAVGDRVNKQAVSDDGGSLCSSFNSSDSNYDLLEKQIQSQKDQIDALQKKLANLSVLVEDTACVFPNKYQKMTDPEAVSIQCVVGGARVSRKFLLDNGRLQLDPVRQAFGLLTVELILDGEPLVLGANIDGYIPMKFSSGSVLQVTGIPIAYTPPVVPKTRSKEALHKP